MKKVFLCGHTGSHNRGCEAIVRSTSEILKKCGIKNFYLATFAASQDIKVGLDREVAFIEYNNYSKHKFIRYISGVYTRILHNYEKGQKFIQKPLWSKLDNASLCFNIGGDTYCYSRPIVSFGLTSHNERSGIPTVLWACSIQKELIDYEMIKDLNKYSFIIPREIITYNTLLEVGIPKEKMFLCCDPAFLLDIEETKLPNGFIEGKTIGLNISPLVLRQLNNNNIVFRNIRNFIDFILHKTDYNICMIPHVYDYSIQNEDIWVLKAIKSLYENNDRIFLVNEDLNCMQLKYIISKCRFFIGARTHSTIAAYSTSVPTLALGYSVKSMGIATDLFGTYNGYVLLYNKFQNNDQLKEAFINIMNNENIILKKYKEVLPSYKERVIEAAKFILKMENNER